MRLVLAAGLAAALAGPCLADDELGRKVFTQIAQPPCALCHRLDAAGAAGKVGPSLDETKPDRERVLDTVRNGIGPMPGYDGKLTAREIEAVAAYVAKVAGGK